MKKYNKIFDGYKLFYNPKLSKEFKRISTLDEYFSDLNKTRNKCVIEYNDKIHVTLSRKLISEKISIILLLFSLLLFQYNQTSFTILIITSLISILLSFHWNNSLKLYIKSFNMCITIINMDIEEYGQKNFK
jgi:hypothetical protein